MPATSKATPSFPPGSGGRTTGKDKDHETTEGKSNTPNKYSEIFAERRRAREKEEREAREKSLVRFGYLDRPSKFGKKSQQPTTQPLVVIAHKNKRQAQVSPTHEAGAATQSVNRGVGFHSLFKESNHPEVDKSTPMGRDSENTTPSLRYPSTAGFSYYKPSSPSKAAEAPKLSLTEFVEQFEKALEAYKGTAEYQGAVLRLLESTSVRVEEIITPQSIDLVANQGSTPARNAIFKVFETTRRLLSRESKAVILEETSHRFKGLAIEIDLESATIGRGRYAASPFEWVNTHIIHLIDKDMRELVQPISKGTEWKILYPQPYLHLHKKLYDRIFGRNSRLL